MGDGVEVSMREGRDIIRNVGKCEVRWGKAKQNKM